MIMTILYCPTLIGIPCCLAGGVFVVLLCGLAFAVLVAIFEFCYNSKRNASAEQVSYENLAITHFFDARLIFMHVSSTKLFSSKNLFNIKISVYIFSEKFHSLMILSHQPITSHTNRALQK